VGFFLLLVSCAKTTRRTRHSIAIPRTVLYITASLLGNWLLQFELPVSFGKQVFFSAGHTASPHFAGTFVMMA
jgi:hypothetical protein